MNMLYTFMNISEGGLWMPEIKDKHLQLDQEKLDQARQILGTRTERETIESALDLVVSEEGINRLLRKCRGRGTIRKIFD